jgi:hypothetical protein
VPPRDARRRIQRTDAEQLRRHETRQHSRRREADTHTNGHERHSIPHEHAPHFAGAGAERDTDPDLWLTLSDRVADDTVKSR